MLTTKGTALATDTHTASISPSMLFDKRTAFGNRKFSLFRAISSIPFYFEGLLYLRNSGILVGLLEIFY